MKVEVEIPEGFECKVPFECPLMDWNWGLDEPLCFCSLLDKSLETEETTGGWRVFKHPDCPSSKGVQENAQD